MTWLAPKLNKRIQLLKAVQDPGVGVGLDGGLSRGYELITSLWAGFKPVKAGQYIRGVQVDDGITHIFTIRRVGVDSLGKQFAAAFSMGFDSTKDQSPVKTEYFIFLNYGNQITNAFSGGFNKGFIDISLYQGRLFRIKSVTNNKEQDEFYLLDCGELEEQNTGYQK